MRYLNINDRWLKYVLNVVTRVSVRIVRTEEERKTKLNQYDPV